MAKILVVGTNTRALACSAKKLGHEVYSVEHFCTQDLQECSDYTHCTLTQEPYQSCGKLEENFDPVSIAEKAMEYVDKVDYILYNSGVLPKIFPKEKIKGNANTDHVENKFKFYKKIRNKFKVPETFLVSNVHEIQEILQEFRDKKFILKPLTGCGGAGITAIDYGDEEEFISEMILQEYIPGDNISASVLSTKREALTVITSKQLIGIKELGQKEPYGYCGNIVPYHNNPEIKETSKELIKYLSLIGSNGVDMIYHQGELNIIEVNPRFQGTFECVESSLGINMVDAHLQACEDNLIDPPKPEKFAVKMIVFAKNRSMVKNVNIDHVYDLPYKQVIIEKNEPVATVITNSKILEDAIYSAKQTVQKVYCGLEKC
ncbi:MAG: ATP-grasp domain-containing protein [Methanobacteriaceae archaeon]|nr:ATP-grasp domain-containing protein [Methanobacteriaceae archaeon]